MNDKVSIARVSLIGIEMGLSVTIGILSGLWLDHHLHTAPWLMLLFLAIGIAAGFRNLYAIMMQLEHQARADEEARRKRRKSLS